LSFGVGEGFKKNSCFAALKDESAPEMRGPGEALGPVVV
jgi:hypothetical protein